MLGLRNQVFMSVLMREVDFKKRFFEKLADSKESLIDPAASIESQLQVCMNAKNAVNSLKIKLKDFDLADELSCCIDKKMDEISSRLDGRFFQSAYYPSCGIKIFVLLHCVRIIKTMAQEFSCEKQCQNFIADIMQLGSRKDIRDRYALSVVLLNYVCQLPFKNKKMYLELSKLLNKSTDEMFMCDEQKIEILMEEEKSVTSHRLQKK